MGALIVVFVLAEVGGACGCCGCRPNLAAVPRYIAQMCRCYGGKNGKVKINELKCVRQNELKCVRHASVHCKKKWTPENQKCVDTTEECVQKCNYEVSLDGMTSKAICRFPRCEINSFSRYRVDSAFFAPLFFEALASRFFQAWCTYLVAAVVVVAEPPTSPRPTQWDSKLRPPPVPRRLGPGPAE